MTLRRRLILTIGSGSFAKPEYVTTVNVELWGGGGAGSNNPAVPSNGGAAGGQYVSGTLSYPTESVSIPFIVAGAVSATAGNNPAVNGLPSIWDGGLVIARGGSGSVGITAGVGSTDGAVGDLVYRGGTGRTGNAVGFIEVHGGGGAGSTGNGNDASSSPAGAKSEFGGAGGSGASGANKNGLRAGGGGAGQAGSGSAGLLRVNYNLIPIPTSSNTTTVLLTEQGSGTFVKPSSVRKILVEGWGAGGRGAYATGTFGTFSYIGAGGAGGNYARTLVYYPRVLLNIPYVVCTQNEGGFLSASIWNAPITNIPQMIATRGMNGPDMFCTASGASSTCTDINGQSYNSTIVASGSIVGCIGDVIYQGGSSTSHQEQDIGAGGYGGGGAGSLDNGMNALYIASLGGSKIDIGGESTDDFGGAGAANSFSQPAGPIGFAGGGGGPFAALSVSGSLGAPGLIRLTLFEGPLISKIEWNGNTLLLGYELDNATSYSAVIDGSEFVRIENGYEYSWVPNTNYILEGDVRWIPTTSTATQTGWDGANGWRAFLEYARAKNKFNFYVDSNEPESIESYLVEPLNGEHSLEIDGTRRISLVIRNTTTPYEGF